MYVIMVHMQERHRLYTEILADHLRRHRQIALVSGPRQVGKTTTCRSISDAYLNWDNSDDRRKLLRGPAALAEALQLDRLGAQMPVAVLDELHKYSKWKTLLKGFFDTYGERVRLIVTGSSRLDVFRRGGDSLMGRYLLYRMHPWSVGESFGRSCPRRKFDRPPRLHPPTGTHFGSTGDSLNRFSAATPGSRAGGGPYARSSYRAKTCANSRM